MSGDGDAGQTVHEDRSAEQALVPTGEGKEFALRTALHLWATATTDPETHCRRDLLRAKQQAAADFFSHCGKLPGEVGPVDVEAWRKSLEGRGFKPATVYARLSRLSSFYEWAMRDPQLAGLVEKNPVRLARPKAPKAYQTESVESLDDEQMSKLLANVRKRAAAGDLVGKRDYALLLLFVTTGMRRQEVIGLRGSDLEQLDRENSPTSLPGGTFSIARTDNNNGSVEGY